MALNITTGTATPIGLARAIRITFNAALTGNVVVAAAGSALYGTPAATVATITNPTVGGTYTYGGLHEQGGITITPSTTTDLTVTKVNKLS